MSTSSPSSSPNPGRIFDVLNAHQQSAALRGAIELGLFTRIRAGLRTADSLAADCKADPRAMRILCDFLVVHAFLTKDGQEYGLTQESAIFLDERSPNYLGKIARFMNSPDLLRAFDNVTEIVLRGTTLLRHEGTTETEYAGWVEFARSMVPLMMPAAEFIGGLAAELKVGPTRVLDIAAGHGMFGISVARANPQASIVALDWAPVLEVALENATRAGIQGRYSLLKGDALSIPFGKDFDVVLLTNFLHHFDRTTCRSLMRKVHECLRDDGCAITLEFVPNEDRVSPPVPATFAFMMLGTTPAGDAYTFSEYDAMWKSAGFKSTEMMDVPDSPQRVMVSRK